MFLGRIPYGGVCRSDARARGGKEAVHLVVASRLADLAKHRPDLAPPSTLFKVQGLAFRAQGVGSRAWCISGLGRSEFQNGLTQGGLVCLCRHHWDKCEISNRDRDSRSLPASLGQVSNSRSRISTLGIAGTNATSRISRSRITRSRSATSRISTRKSAQSQFRGSASGNQQEAGRTHLHEDERILAPHAVALPSVARHAPVHHPHPILILGQAGQYHGRENTPRPPRPAATLGHNFLRGCPLHLFNVDTNKRADIDLAVLGEPAIKTKSHDAAKNGRMLPQMDAGCRQEPTRGPRCFH